MCRFMVWEHKSYPYSQDKYNIWKSLKKKPTGQCDIFESWFAQDDEEYFHKPTVKTSKTHRAHTCSYDVIIIRGGGWSLPAGGAPPGAAQTSQWLENETIVLLQRESRFDSNQKMSLRGECLDIQSQSDKKYRFETISVKLPQTALQRPVCSYTKTFL